MSELEFAEMVKNLRALSAPWLGDEANALLEQLIAHALHLRGALSQIEVLQNDLKQLKRN